MEAPSGLLDFHRHIACFPLVGSVIGFRPWPSSPATSFLRTLRTTPAMAAGVTDRLWEVSDLVALLEAEERGLERAA